MVDKKKVIFFGVQSATLGDFSEIAMRLQISPIYVDNLAEDLGRAPSDSISVKDLEDFHLKLPVVISIVTPAHRLSAMNHAINLGFTDFLAFISPNADIAANAIIEPGVFVNNSAIIGHSTKLAKNSVVNRGANIGHDVEIGEFTHVAPSACILGFSKIGKSVLVGANSTILNNLNIGDGAIIGAGAVVIHDVASGETVVGNPARPIAR